MLDIEATYGLARKTFHRAGYHRSILDLDEAVQDAVVACWRAMRSFDPEKGHLVNYLYRVILNSFKETLAFRRGPRHEERVSMTLDDGRDLQVWEDYRVSQISPGRNSRKGRKFVDLELVKKLVADGKHMAEIARIIGVSRPTVSKACKRAGVVAKKISGGIPRVDYSEVVRLADEEGKSTAQIAFELDLSTNRTREILRDYGQKAKPR